MTAEEQALFEELEREAGGAEASATKIKLDTIEPQAASPTRAPSQPAKVPSAPSQRESDSASRNETRRAEPEPEAG